ncbi:MAG: branched-chain amino acid ABC transporter permease [Candidatus Izemoplasmatales bacterium]|nr:branched-chain amino acid ABC transporter permease [bacterium]MDZ4196838.1 branched-chain amino acid ABC transporter permease [Candidatus Izemoplasmatales bacterium]
MNSLSLIRQKRIGQLKSLIHHPYFGFLVVGALLLFMQGLRAAGVNISITVMRTFGLTMIYVIIGLGFSILLGYAGLASLGTAGFVGIGTYLVGYLTTKMGFPIYIIIIISILGAILIGLIIGFISLRIEGMYLAIITLGLSEILNEVFKNAVEFTNGTNGLNMSTIVFFGTFEVINIETIFTALVFILVLVMVITFNIMKSPTGRAMLAMKNSESAAQAMGVSILKYRLMAFMIATVYAVVGGVLYMTYFGFSIPSSWGLAFSLNILAAIIVGGSRSIYGVLLGTFMIFGLDMAVFQTINVSPTQNASVAAFIARFPEHTEQLSEFFRSLNGAIPTMSYIFNGVLIIIVIMFYPGGLYQLVITLKAKISKLISKVMKKVKVYRYGEDR